MERKLVQPPMEIPQQIKHRTTYDTAIPFMGIYLKETKTLIEKDICTPMLTEAFTIAKTWKQLGITLSEISWQMLYDLIYMQYIEQK